MSLYDLQMSNIAHYLIQMTMKSYKHIFFNGIQKNTFWKNVTSFCPYNGIQWWSKQNWTPLIIIVYKKLRHISLCVLQMKEKYSGLE